MRPSALLVALIVLLHAIHSTQYGVLDPPVMRFASEETSSEESSSSSPLPTAAPDAAPGGAPSALTTTPPSEEEQLTDTPERIAMALGMKVETKLLPRKIYKSSEKDGSPIWLEYAGDEWKWTAGVPATVNNKQTGSLVIAQTQFQSLSSTPQIEDPAWKGASISDGAAMVLEVLSEYLKKKADLLAGKDVTKGDPQKAKRLDPLEAMLATIAKLSSGDKLLKAFGEVERVKLVLRQQEVAMEVVTKMQKLVTDGHIKIDGKWFAKMKATEKASKMYPAASKYVSTLVSYAKSLKTKSDKAEAVVKKAAGDVKQPKFTGILNDISSAKSGKETMSNGAYLPATPYVGGLLLLGALDVGFTLDGKSKAPKFMPEANPEIRTKISSSPFFKLAKFVTPKATNFKQFKKRGVPALVALGMALTDKNTDQVDKYLERFRGKEYGFLVHEMESVPAYWDKHQASIVKTVQDLFEKEWYSPG